jgi:acyl-[acyl-carrier-protein]-phospholipid O-acyltransferase/long-chain-fatty-acid--[acyl-carrier-protein] ligase
MRHDPGGRSVHLMSKAVFSIRLFPAHRYSSAIKAMSDIKATSEPAVSQPSLRGFWSLFITQFQGAFSDNVFKFLVLFLITSTRPPEERDKLIVVALGMFAMPFILFSMAGGFLADRFPKRSVIVWIKVAEVAVMTLGLIGLWLGSLPFLFAVIFLMSAQSAFFGPSKYGSLPELLPEKKLSWGNGILGLGTFVAIIAGSVVGGELHQGLGADRYLSGFLLVALAGAGWLASLGITRLPAANPQKEFRWNPLGDLWTNLQKTGGDRVLMLAIAGSTYFWFIAALFGEPTLLIYSKDVLLLNEDQISRLRACMAIGIGIGSLVAGFVSGRKIEYGLIPMGAFGLSVCAALLGIFEFTRVQAAIVLGFLGFSGGFYVVPINALIQHRPDSKDKGSVIAANAWLTSLGVLLASGAFWVLRSGFSLEPTTIFLIGAGVTFVGTVYAINLVPDSLLRLMLWGLTHTIYRIRVMGRDNIPTKGGALFVCNHVSFVDAVLMLASTDRRVRFIMFKAHYELPYIYPFARILGVIPISSEQRPREMIKSLQTASDAIRDGEVVCIFAEGQITRTGHLLPFRRGFERIMKDVEAPIIPVGIDGVWGSIFSFDKGRFLWKLPRRLPYPVTINYGNPLPHTATPLEVRSAVQELLVEAWQKRKTRMRPLPIAFVHTARKYPFRFAFGDAQGTRVKFSSALVRTVFLARRLRKIWAGQEMVGLLLPPSIPGALVNYAAMLLGKVPVNLNYTVSEETLASCIHQCGIKTVVTSKVFVDKLKLKVPCEIVLLEQIAGMERRSPIRQDASDEPKHARSETGAPASNPGTPFAVKRATAGEKITAVLIAWLVPDRWIQQALGCDKKSQLDGLATVIFSSGSTGEPKGVMLTHYNVGSNVEQLEQVFGLNCRDRLLGILPFFHSFGFMGTLTLPAMLGVGVVYHPNPLDGKTIGPLVRDYEVTFLLATPTFLQIYMRGCAAEDFGSLRVVMTGAEKLPDRLSAAFEEQFGIRPLEGYGCTECSPAVAVNTLDFRSAGFRQVGGKRGKIGHPLPGVSIRIVDPQSMEPVPYGQPGLMLVKGPNVMQGYLGRPEKTAEVLITMNGSAKWYVTGDIAAVDEDGFLQITDRLSRFSKIGGEMVPHIKVEEKLHELAGSTEQTFVVAGVPDEKKGERLVVMHKLQAEKLQTVLEKLGQSDLPNLWKPRADQFFYVDAFPYLGTGKLDLRKVKDLAASFNDRNLAEAGLV